MANGILQSLAAPALRMPGNPTQTTTPAAGPQKISTIPGVNASLDPNAKTFTPQTSQNSIMGIKANAPGMGATPPANTLPASQTSPVQTTTGGPQQQTQPNSGTTLNVPSTGPNGQTIYTSGTNQAVQTPATNSAGSATNIAPVQPPTFGGILGSLALTAQQGSPQVQAANQNLLQTQTNVQNALGGIGTEAIPLEFQQGRQALLSNLGTQQIANATQQVTNALTSQGQQITGLGTAANLAQPSTAQYGQTVFNPATGTYGTPGAGDASGLDPQTAAAGLAQQVVSGQMSYSDAVSSLGYAGNAGQQFLNNAIQQASPGFNTNQAQVNTQVQGQLAPQASLAQGELANLQSTLATAPALQTTGIPAINAIGNFINSLLGNPGSQALADARSAAISAVGTALATAYGGTPTSYDNLIGQWFPANATPAQVQAGIQQFNNLISYRAQSFGSPGTASLNNAPSTNTNNTGSVNYNF